MFLSIFNPIDNLADFVIFKILHLEKTSIFAQNLHIFIYSLLKILILIFIVGFVTGIIKSLLSPEKTRSFLSGKKSGVGNILASIAAVFTPVDTFSVIPFFYGLLESGIPAGIAFTYLITAPMTNEIAFALFWGIFGPKIAFTYLACGISIGILAGIIIGWINPEKHILPIQQSHQVNFFECKDGHRFALLLKNALINAINFLKDTWFYIIIGIGLAVLINGYIPKNIIANYIGRNNPFSVPIAVFMVIFLYVNMATALPIITILVNYGLPIGTLMAFTMAVTATSMPELLILKKVLKAPLLAIYLVLLLGSIILSGYILNYIF